MGRDLGKAGLLRRPTPLTGVLLAAVVAVLVGCGPASAADPTPSPDPFAASTPAVSPPSQQQIDDAKAALNRLRRQGSTSPKPLKQVAGPTARADAGSVTSRISDEAWWTIGAGLLVLLVVSETGRLSIRRAKHRKGV